MDGCMDNNYNIINAAMWVAEIRDISKLDDDCDYDDCVDDDDGNDDDDDDSADADEVRDCRKSLPLWNCLLGPRGPRQGLNHEWESG